MSPIYLHSNFTVELLYIAFSYVIPYPTKRMTCTATWIIIFWSDTPSCLDFLSCIWNLKNAERVRILSLERLSEERKTICMTSVSRSDIWLPFFYCMKSNLTEIMRDIKAFCMNVFLRFPLSLSRVSFEMLFLPSSFIFDNTYVIGKRSV